MNCHYSRINCHYELFFLPDFYEVISGWWRLLCQIEKGTMNNNKKLCALCVSVATNWEEWGLCGEYFWEGCVFFSNYKFKGVVMGSVFSVSLWQKKGGL